MTKTTPFIFGSQYYRAPTPEAECWEKDLAHMSALGFNMVKYFVQWRWSHRRNSGSMTYRYVFDDLDRLMDLAHHNGLGVTLNFILDVAPTWLCELYPDARQVMNNGQVIEPYAVAHRQIGGHPGPCYNHPGARQERQRFVTAALEHFRGHPALAMWDMWNEPELSFPQRTPDVQRLVCYCPHCRAGFIDWLQRKYASLEARDVSRLNRMWGRCYEDWQEVELPRDPGTITDFIDWREFHIATMTAEAAWRLELAHAMDPQKVSYLHVVPNTMDPFNSVSCSTDDFELAEHCDVFAATMNGVPTFTTQVLSAARGKVCYNVESHINHGCTSLHQRILSLEDVLKDLLPQVGLGIKGFLFWQYRAETLGFEAPAWGLVKTDGSERPVTRAVRTFWEKLSPHAARLMECPPRPAEVGIWKSRKNEIFSFSIHRSLENLIEGIDSYIQALYWSSHPFRFISGEMLERNELDGLKLLIMPAPYYLTEAEADTLKHWVRDGGVLLSEAHLGGYNGTTGRHSQTVPGCGLAEAFGLHEADATSSYHLKLADSALYKGSSRPGAVTADVEKALADSDLSGGKYYPIQLSANGGEAEGGRIVWGALTYALLEGEGITADGLQAAGTFDGSAPCLVSKPVGKGWVLYAGTNLGQGAKKDPAGLGLLLQKALDRAGVQPTLNVAGSAHVHVDALLDEAGRVRFIMAFNRSQEEQRITLEGHGAACRGIFSGIRWQLDGRTEVILPPGCVDLWVADDSVVK